RLLIVLGLALGALGLSGALTPARDVAAEVPEARGVAAANWAVTKVGSQEWNTRGTTWCGRFVANAYGELAYGYDFAYQLHEALGSPTAFPTTRGQLVFF